MTDLLTVNQVTSWSIGEYFNNLSTIMKFKDDFIVRRKLIRSGREDLISRHWDCREMKAAVDWVCRTHVTDTNVLDVCEVLAISEINPYYFFPNGCDDATEIVKNLSYILCLNCPYTTERNVLIALLKCKGPTERPAFERFREQMLTKLSTNWDCVGIIKNANPENI